MKDNAGFISNQVQSSKGKGHAHGGRSCTGGLIKSRDIQGVEKETASFLQEVIGLRPVG
ncbi:MAG: hypothetical protein U0T56_02260 [Ferruginibacter sp.]